MPLPCHLSLPKPSRTTQVETTSPGMETARPAMETAAECVACVGLQASLCSTMMSTSRAEPYLLGDLLSRSGMSQVTHAG